MIECIKCGQFWESTATNLILAQGMCPGPKLYGVQQHERPWIIPAKRGPIWWGKHKLHTSHRAAWYRGVLFCTGCGHFSLNGNSLRGLGKRCYNNPAGRYCQMTIKLIRHGTKRAGFSDWPEYDNIPGKGEPMIANIAYQDTAWDNGPPPRTYNTGKTLTGEKVAEKIRDLRIRRNLTGKTSLPRLRCKTSPKQIEAEQVDFEEEVARFKRDIAKDIQHLEQQAYKEPAWITKILDKEKQQESQQARQRPSSSSSSWEQPMSDTQAVEISNFIMTTAEEQAFFAGDDCAMSSQDNNTSDAQIESEEAPPSWEQHWELETQQPATQVADSFDWEAWLAEISELPVQGYRPFDDLLKSPHYMQAPD